MSESKITSCRNDHILTLRMNRPEKKNALNAEMYEELIDRFRYASAEDDIRVVVLKGAEGDFTSGNDLTEFQEIPEDADESTPVYQFIRDIAFFDKLLVTQVEGYAVGIGATILLHSDYVICEENAQIRFPFVDLGGVPEAGSTLLLPMMAGYQKAAELIFTADYISAKEGDEIGFVTEVVETDEIEDRLEEVTRMLASKPPEAMQESKRLLKENYRKKLKETIKREMKAFHERIQSDEAAQALSALMEGKDTNF